MHSGLRVLDPIITTAHITRNHGYMIYDVLLAVNENFEVRPQMADFRVSADNLTYVFTLRDGLLFHDGAPVTAADVVASLTRWGKRDSGGKLIFAVTKSLEATDAKTVTWTLSEPFAPLVETVGKLSALPAFIMPERIAKTPADEAITEYIGSGPFVFDTAEFQPGVSVTYTRFKEYVPRDEPANWLSGGKVVNVDIVRWVTMPDAQTALNALSSGEIDYLEQVRVDLLPLLDGVPDVVTEVRNSLGFQALARMNFLHPPFNNQKIRQAALRALGQEAFLAAMVGNPDYYSTCGAIFGCGTPLGTETGAESLTSGGDPKAARALLEEAGYDGSPVVLLQATDVPLMAPMAVVAAQQLREAGFTVDLQSMDWQTLVTRRASQAAPSKGGWSMFFSFWTIPEVLTPLTNTTVDGKGEKGFIGWALDPELEALRGDFIKAATQEARLAAADKVQKRVMETVNYIPLGQYREVQARRSDIVNMIPAPVPVFWQIDKSE